VSKQTNNFGESPARFFDALPVSEVSQSKRRKSRKRFRKRRGLYLPGADRSGLAALEFVMTTAVACVVLGFSGYTIIRLCRYVFSLIGSMVGSPFI
jgi:hypothetical protein